jgi:hypothetical protein
MNLSLYKDLDALLLMELISLIVPCGSALGRFYLATRLDPMHICSLGQYMIEGVEVSKSFS